MVRLHIKLNHECRNVVANILPPDPPTINRPWVWVQMSKLTFSKHGHVAYQIKSRMHKRGSKYFAARPLQP